MDTKPSDVEAIVKDLEAQAMSRVTIPSDATTMQKYTALFAPIAGDAELNHSQVQWFLGACVGNVAGEFDKDSDPNWVQKDMQAVIKQFAEMVKEPGAKVRQLYSVYEAFKDPAARVADLSWDHHRLVLMREKDPAKRLQLLQTAASQNLSVGDLQKQINQAHKGDVDPRQALVDRVERATAQLARAQAALKRYDQQHGTGPATPPDKSPRNPSKASKAA